MYQVIKRQIKLTLNELSIKVNIADRNYPLTVKTDEEEKVRKAAKLINDKLKSYGKAFAVNDKQDIISMCALELATELIGMQEATVIAENGYSEQLSTIGELLKEVSI